MRSGRSTEAKTMQSHDLPRASNKNGEGARGHQRWTTLKPCATQGNGVDSEESRRQSGPGVRPGKKSVSSTETPRATNAKIRRCRAKIREGRAPGGEGQQKGRIWTSSFCRGQTLENDKNMCLAEVIRGWRVPGGSTIIFL